MSKARWGMEEGSSQVRWTQDRKEGQQDMELVHPSPSLVPSYIKWLQKRKGYAQSNYRTPIYHRQWGPFRPPQVSPRPLGRNINPGRMMVQTSMAPSHGRGTQYTSLALLFPWLSMHFHLCWYVHHYNLSGVGMQTHSALPPTSNQAWQGPLNGSSLAKTQSL